MPITRHPRRASQPVFVYGTLRPAGNLACNWQEFGAAAVHDGQVVAPGHRIIRAPGAVYPMMLPAPGYTTVGCLIIPDDTLVDALMARLDYVEGVPVHGTYHRTIIGVTVVDVHGVPWTTTAYAYVVTDTTIEQLRHYGHLDDDRLDIPNGDWYDHCGIGYAAI